MKCDCFISAVVSWCLSWGEMTLDFLSSSLGLFYKRDEVLKVCVGITAITKRRMNIKTSRRILEQS